MAGDPPIEYPATVAWNGRIVAGCTAASLALVLIVADLSRRADPSQPPVDPVLMIDPNHAPAEVLLALPRLGPALVGRIIAERDRRPFASLQDLDDRVEGIGPATMAALAPHLRIDPP